jgi:formamidopyrimidine-DNA glycosylase
MPELPEVETVCRSLSDQIVGRKIQRVTIRRRGIIHGPAQPHHLLVGNTISEIRRHGKQMALIGKNAPHACVCVHLGMTGALVCRQSKRQVAHDRHCHVIWHLGQESNLVFRDPRRFGGIWTLASFAKLEKSRWASLGPDALQITPTKLRKQLANTARPIKAALLDQNVLAGLGNIYVDELLFNCHLHPANPACLLPFDQLQSLVTKMRRLLPRAIAKGGSSTRDYVDGRGRMGHFQLYHRVYGRAKQPCRRCQTTLLHTKIAGRTTVFCPKCQRYPTPTKKY